MSLDVGNSRFALKRPVTNLKWLKNKILIAPAHFLLTFVTQNYSMFVGGHAHMQPLRFRGVRESRNTFLRTSVKHQYRFRRAPQESVVDQRPYIEERQCFRGKSEA